MKVKVFSDLHLEMYSGMYDVPHLGEGDILILAGDIICARHLKKRGHLMDLYLAFFENCSKDFEKVLYVLGNHSFYGYNYEGAHRTIQKYLPDNFHLLENDTVKIENYHFIGFTLWSNFRNGNPIEMLEAERCMNDYRMIRIGSNYRKLRAQDTLNLHLESRDYLLKQLETIQENVFVISHHAPSYQSVADQFKTATCNSAYCSDLDNLILNHPQIKYWIHGHVHTPFNYKIGECNVICNPVGYPSQNTNYNHHLYLNLE